MNRNYRLTTGTTIEQEWSVRLPNEGQEEFQTLFDANPGGKSYLATLPEVKAVRDDCAFMLDPLGPQLTGGERRAYLALLRQCCAHLGERMPTFERKMVNL